MLYFNRAIYIIDDIEKLVNTQSQEHRRVLSRVDKQIKEVRSTPELSSALSALLPTEYPLKRVQKHNDIECQIITNEIPDKKFHKNNK